MGSKIKLLALLEQALELITPSTRINDTKNYKGACTFLTLPNLATEPVFSLIAFSLS